MEASPASDDAETLGSAQASFPGDDRRPTTEELQRELADALSAPEWQRAYRLELLVPLLPVGLLAQALEEVLRWDNYYARQGLGFLVPHLSPERVARALEGVFHWESYYRRDGLALLVPHLSPELIARALEGVLLGKAMIACKV